MNTAELTEDEIIKFRNYIAQNEMYFNPDYTRGYLSALLDLERLFKDNFFDCLCRTTKAPRTGKTFHALLRFFIDNRQPLRLGKLDKNFIGYNQNDKEFFYVVNMRRTK